MERKVEFVSHKGDAEALVKFMDAVKELIVEYSDALEDDYERKCSLTLVVGHRTKKLNEGERGDDVEDTAD